jgi:hypothetical protein
MSALFTSKHHRGGLVLATLVPSFYLAEWLLVAATASIFTWLRHSDYSPEQIWLVFWAGNLLVSAAFIACNDLLQVDFTLMQGLRKLTEMTLRRSIWLGILLELGIFIRLLLWDGPCQLLIYSRARLPSSQRQIAFLIVTSGVQMFVWTKLYCLGYDGIGEVIANLKGGL